MEFVGEEILACLKMGYLEKKRRKVKKRRKRGGEEYKKEGGVGNMCN